MFHENKKRSRELQNICKEYISSYEMSFAVIDMNHKNTDGQHEMFGYNMDHFIYPASVYKIFIGAEVLRQIELGLLQLDQKITIKSPNDVDQDARIFPGDTRKLLQEGDVVTVDYLLALMLERSDNTASNTLIDLVTREAITENIIYRYGWHGSEVTRKFLDRKKDEKYQFSKTTLSCARHLAEYMYLVETKNMISPWVSEKLSEYMSKFNRHGKQGLWLKEYYKKYYCKGGWLETNLWNMKSLLPLMKSLIQRKWGRIQWSNDVGVVTGKHSHYVVVVMSVSKQFFPTNKFPIQAFAKRVYTYMEQS
jgi:hypothetical protein